MKQYIVVAATWCVLGTMPLVVGAQTTSPATTAAVTIESKRAEIINQVNAHPSAKDEIKRAVIVEVYGTDNLEEMDRLYTTFLQRVVSEELREFRITILNNIQAMEHLQDAEKQDYLQKVDDAETREAIESVYREAELKGKNGWKLENSKWTFYISGISQTGWIQHQGKRYYVTETGAVTTGWRQLAGVWYYFNDAGEMAIGWKKISDKWYYLKEDGAMAKGWLQLNGTFYYLNEGGDMAVGWKQVSNHWYYLNESGAMAKGWIQLKGIWYYLHESGAMAKGWIQLKGTWYYLHESGAMAKGWLQLNGKWYYLQESGAMVTGVQRLGSTTYRFDTSGVWLP